MSSDYRRTPLPPGAKTPLGWLLACIALLLASPFIGFALHGRVAERGLALALPFGLLAVLGLAVLAFRRRRVWRSLSPALRAEWTTGRLVQAEGAPPVAPPVRFTQGCHWFELRSDGLVLSRSCLLGIQSLQGVPGLMQLTWVTEQAGQLFVPWTDVERWEVKTDSDGPDYYRLALHPRGTLLLRRLQPAEGTECALLDAVRSVGGRPVLLCDDVVCAEP